MKKNSVTSIKVVALLISLILIPKVALSQPSTGENMKRLTLYQGQDVEPEWDPRGGAIAYVRQKTGSIYEEYKVASSSQGGENPLLTGLSTDFGVSVYSSWIGSTGFIAIHEAISGFEMLKFNTALAPFNRTITNGADSANSVLLNIDGGGGSSLIRMSRDGSTALVRFSSSGSGGTVSIRIGAVSSMAAQAASTFGTAVLSQSVGSDPRYSYGAGLSPDGSQFVISSPTLGGSTTPHDLLYGSSQGGTLANLTNSSGQLITNTYPDISPDGTRIVFSRGTNGSGNNRDLYIINVDGTGLTQLTDTPNFVESFPSWSPDGTAVAFTGVHISGHEGDPPSLQSGEIANTNIYMLQLPSATSRKTVTPKTKLSDPPIVDVNSRIATFTFVPFFKAAQKAASLAASIMQSGKISVKYTFDYKLQYGKVGAAKKDIKALISKRNKITVRNLKPGAYRASYQVEVFKKQGSRTSLVGRTKFSPIATFNIS